MTEEKNDKSKGPVSSFGLMGTASTMGMHMISGPIVGGGLGYLADSYFDSWPWGAAIGVVLGILAGFRNVYIDARHIIKTQEEMDENNRKF